jgi:hypothetical protein
VLHPEATRPRRERREDLHAELVPSADAADVVPCAEGHDDDPPDEETHHVERVGVEHLRHVALGEGQRGERREETSDDREAAEARDHPRVDPSTARVVDDAATPRRPPHERRDGSGHDQGQDESAERCSHRLAPLPPLVWVSRMGRAS